MDFVIQQGRAPTPVQVTVEGVAERHLRALDSFYEAFPHANEAIALTIENFPEAFAARDRGAAAAAPPRPKRPLSRRRALLPPEDEVRSPDRRTRA